MEHLPDWLSFSSGRETCRLHHWSCAIDLRVYVRLRYKLVTAKHGLLMEENECDRSTFCKGRPVQFFCTMAQWLGWLSNSTAFGDRSPSVYLDSVVRAAERKMDSDVYSKIVARCSHHAASQRRRAHTLEPRVIMICLGVRTKM